MPDAPDSTAGALVGTVNATDGAALPGVTVTASGDGAPRVETTDDQGRYRMIGIPAGAYTVTAELTGFETGEGGADVRPRETTTLDVTLRLASVGGY